METPISPRCLSIILEPPTEPNKICVLTSNSGDTTSEDYASRISISGIKPVYFLLFQLIRVV